MVTTWTWGLFLSPVCLNPVTGFRYIFLKSMDLTQRFYSWPWINGCLWMVTWSPLHLTKFKSSNSNRLITRTHSKVWAQGQILVQGRPFWSGSFIEFRPKLRLPMFDSWIVPPSIAIEKRGILRDSVITAAFLIFSLW